MGKNSKMISGISGCGLDEELRFCRPTCEPTCSDLSPVCSATCGKAVCMCRRGSVRQAGMCVPQTACRFFDFDFAESKPMKKKHFTGKVPVAGARIAATDTAKIVKHKARPPPNCGQGQQFTRCVCDATCHRDKVCTSCTSGCGCFLHHVRNDSGVCVPFKDCPLPRPKTMPTSTVMFPHATLMRLTKNSPAHGEKSAKQRTHTKADARMPGARPKARAVSIDARAPHSAEEDVKPAPKQLASKHFVPKLQKGTRVHRKGKVVTHGKSGKKTQPKGPSPPGFMPPSAKHHKTGGPPASRPTNFGPPGVTPFLLFRAKRIRRKERALRRLKRRLRAHRAA
ncbi:hypothetical protein Q1695_001797 [Nippostrongylus brasiliensis]|nr:hypothetical protein Q1695_001797 [Nippostrongylus brasiliensis]